MAATTAPPAPTTNAISTAAAVGGHAGVEAYEDMFKEITRKLYGEETGPLTGTQIAQVATGGHLALPEGERSFTTLICDRPGNSDDHLFGLAALMQNGFAQPAINSSAGGQKAATPLLAADWNAGDSEVTHWNTNKSGNGGGRHSKRDSEGRRSNGSSSAASAGGAQSSKRYTCGSCPYSTDRRDLYTRHENIHKTEKPFHCYVCLKQFNRADHVKKHFLRMHRELNYDINKTRKFVSNGRSPSQINPEPPVVAAPAISMTPSSAADFYAPQVLQHHHQQHSDYSVPERAEHLLPPPPPAAPVVEPAQVLSMQKITHQPALHQPSHNSHHNNHEQVQVKVKQEKTPAILSGHSLSPGKKFADKKFSCCYCPWTGTDNWGLKRHLNTHTKPYVCVLCDYKAARSERLVTHVYKVHNKKACNKCSFLADDHAQYLSHQNEAHGHGSPTSGSILKAIGNNNNTNHTSASGAVMQNTDLFGNGIAFGGPTWRPSGVGMHSTQKRGAERLFQYMEADYSDPEDYQNQLKMTALSRSARNRVAQDFHKAGGGVKSSTRKESATSASSLSTASATASSKRPTDPTPNTRSLFANSGYRQTFIREIEEFVVQRLASGELGNASDLDRGSATSLISTPPPAKRRRFTSQDNDKENQQCQKVREKKQVPEWASDRDQVNAQMRQIIQIMAKHYEKEVSAALEGNRKRPSGSLEELERILKNNHELTISIKDKAAATESSIKYNNGDSGLDDEEDEDAESPRSVTVDVNGAPHASSDPQKSKRKSFVPRRNNLAIWNSIRDKHLSRLMSSSHKKSCLVCVQRQSSLNLPHHSISSLILHNKWRHWKKPRKCDQCSSQFKLQYQLVLHKRRMHTI